MSGLFEDLARWEKGELNIDDVAARHPEGNVRGLVGIHMQLATATASPAPDPSAGWAELRLRLPARAPGVAGRLGTRVRRPIVVAAASLLLGGSALALTFSDEIRDGVAGVWERITTILGGEESGDSSSSAPAEVDEALEPFPGDQVKSGGGEARSARHRDNRNPNKIGGGAASKEGGDKGTDGPTDQSGSGDGIGIPGNGGAGNGENGTGTGNGNGGGGGGNGGENRGGNGGGGGGGGNPCPVVNPCEDDEGDDEGDGDEDEGDEDDGGGDEGDEGDGDEDEGDEGDGGGDEGDEGDGSGDEGDGDDGDEDDGDDGDEDDGDDAGGNGGGR
jgi:hypothetical protein